MLCLIIKGAVKSINTFRLILGVGRKNQDDAAKWALERALTITITPPANQTNREAGPRSFAPRAGTTYMSAPIVEPITGFVVSRVFSCLLRATLAVLCELSPSLNEDQRLDKLTRQIPDCSEPLRLISSVVLHSDHYSRHQRYHCNLSSPNIQVL